MRYVVLILAVSLVLPSAVSAQTPVASPVPAPDCSDLYGYRDRAMRAIPSTGTQQRESIDAVLGIPFHEIAGVRRDHLVVAEAFFVDYAENLDAIDPPDVITDAHDAYTARMVLIGHLIHAYADGDVITAIGYQQYLHRNMDTMIEAAAETAVACGERWDAFAEMDPSAWPLLWPDWQEDIDPDVID